jgi:2-hydroxychromene-2-carboxylate isomerase
MTPTLDFIFDFGSPNAYLAYRALPPLLERTGADLNVVPCLLGGIFKATGNQSPIVAYGHIKAKIDYDFLEIRRFVAKHRLTAYRFNPHFPVNTLLLMRGAVFAEGTGQLDSYLEAGLRSMWELGLKMDDPEVFVAAMNDAGLDGAAILAATQEPAVKARLIENTAEAVERGAFGVPTFYVGDEMYFGKDRLGDVEEALRG